MFLGDDERAQVLVVGATLAGVAARLQSAESIAGTVAVVADVDGAVDALAAEQIAVVVAAHDGPDSLATRLHERLPASHDEPVVAVLEAGADPGPVLDAGANDYVVADVVRRDPALLVRRLGAATTVIPSRDSRWFRSLLERTTDVLTVLDEEGVVRYLSPSVRDAIGYEPSELVGATVFSYVHDADRERVETAFASLHEGDGDETVEVQYRFRSADGDWVWVESVAENRADETVGGYVVSSREITERKEKDRQLEHFETLLDVMPDTVVVTDTDGIQREIHGFEGWSGYEPEELVGEHVSKTTPEADLERGAEIVGELLRNDDVEKATYETHIETKDGEVVPFENHMTLLPPDENGRIPGSMSVLRDVSDRKERERRLEQAETVFENAQDAVFLLDVTDAGRLQYRRVNQSYERMTGLTDDEMRGRTPRDVFGDAMGRRIEAKLRDCIDRREPIDFELECETPKLPDSLQTRLTPLVVEGEVEGIVGATRDITERKEREAELRLKNRAMDEAPLGITIADATRPSRPFIYANDGFEQLMGYDEVDIRGHDLGTLAGPETDRDLFGELEMAMDRAAQETVELLLHDRDGTPVWMRVSVAPVTDEAGEPTHIVSFQQDISERKAYETEIERRFDEFGEVLSDQLGDPIARAREHLEAALKAVDDDDVVAAAQTLERTDRRLDDLTTVHAFSVPSREVSETALLGTTDDESPVPGNTNIDN